MRGAMAHCYHTKAAVSTQVGRVRLPGRVGRESLERCLVRRVLRVLHGYREPGAVPDGVGNALIRYVRS